MRPIALEVTAFGPYASQQTLHFSDLHGHSIFLIHGPTGAGKSSLLDAICFALFGESSGGERRASDLRSHHASSQVATEVVFRFAIGQRHYRVTRAPSQERARTRGVGTTTANARAELVELATDAAYDSVVGTLGSTPAEVDAAVKRLLQFDDAQFRQVAMLPQGKFEQFLLAKSNERETLLQKLFDTERYRQVEQALTAEADRLTYEIQGRRAHLQGILQPFEVSSLEALQEQYDSVQSERVVRNTAVAAATEAHTAALEAHTAGQEAAARLAELRRAQAELNAAQRDEAQVQLARESLTLAERAAQLDDLADERTARQRERAKCLAHLQEAEQAHAAGLDAHTTADLAWRDEEARAPERAEATAAATRARQAIAIAEEIAALRGDAATAERALETLLEQQRRDARALADLAAQMAALEQRRQEATLATASLQGYALQLETLVAQRDQLVRLEKLTARRAESESARRRAADDAAQAAADAARTDAAALDIEHRWTAGHAARLAAHLQPGDPCPVCGATDHPRRAVAEGDVLDDAALKDARAVRDAARAREVQAQRALAAAEEQLSRLVEQEQEQHATLGADDTDRAAVEKAIKAAQATLREAQATAATQDAIARQLASATADQEALQRRHDARGSEIETAQLEGQRVQALLADRLLQSPDVDPDPARARKAAANAEAHAAQLMAAHERARQAAAATDRTLAECAASLRERQTASEEAVRATVHADQRFAARLTELGFADDAAYTAARLTADMLVALRDRVTAYDAAVVRATAAFGEALRRAEGVTPPDLPALEERVRSTAAARDEATRADEAAAQQLGRLASAIDTVRVLEAELAIDEARHRDVRHLANVACGKTPRKVSFHRYMLARRLDTVLGNATQRLSTMSSGRFSLQRAVEARDRRAAAGLEIEVFDMHTGLPRRAETLSGGERFLAALALALGLADAVQAEAGGIVLETLFIDEGFGSLDEQTLEQCLDVLLSLQEGGRRLVGIISHVAMLLDRMPARLSVRRGIAGSEAAFEVR